MCSDDGDAEKYNICNNNDNDIIPGWALYICG